MILHKVSVLAALAERGTMRLISSMEERTYYIWDDYEWSEHSDIHSFSRVSREIFFQEIRSKQKIDEDIFVDLTILSIEPIPSSKLEELYRSRPEGTVYYSTL